MVNFSMIMQMSKNVADPHHADLASSSFLWVTNPCLADPTFGLPLFFTGIMMANLKLAQKNVAADSEQAEMLGRMFMILPITLLPM